jgi:putative sterol carrier protein
LAKGIGATRMGAIEVTFAQETELDLFTEQCFGPAFGQVLTTSVNLLLDAGYPPEAVLLELYMSGEFAYTLGKIAEMGMIEQTALHSRTSQYGSMSRGMRFILPELREKMQTGLHEIRSGAFAQEWAEEQAAGSPTLEMLKESVRSLPLYQLERELRQALGSSPQFRPDTAPTMPTPAASVGFLGRGLARLRHLRRRSEIKPESPSPTEPRQPASVGLSRALARLRRLRRQQDMQSEESPPADALSPTKLETVLRAFLTRAEDDPALQAFADSRQLTVHYRLSDADLEFAMSFHDGTASGSLGAPESKADVQLTMKADLLDGMLTGRTNAMRAAMTGKLSFSGDARSAMAQQQIQNDLIRLYSEARKSVLMDK